MMIKNHDLYASTPCLTRPICILLMTSQTIANDITNALYEPTIVAPAR